MILHVDMDAFYASVEERERPELKSKPVIVGGAAEGRGVVCAANYRARKFGVHSAMPSSQAHRLCPDAVFLPPRLEFYADVSRDIREIFHRYTPLVEPLSLDEAFLDVSGSETLFGESESIGRQIKQTILEELQLVASVGVAPNKFLAKLASDLDKPDGLTVVPQHDVQGFLDPLPIDRIWGIGKVGQRRFQQLGVRTIRDLRQLSVEILVSKFGQHGRQLWRLAHGQDSRRVEPEREAKSVSHETTFARDIESMEALRAWALHLVELVTRRIRRRSMKARTVQLKVRYNDFHTVTRRSTLPKATNSTQAIWNVVSDLLSDKLPDRYLAVRLLGVGVSGFGESKEHAQRLLFDEQPEIAESSQIDATTDAIMDKFGITAIQRGSGLLHNAQHRPQPRPEPKKDESP